MRTHKRILGSALAAVIALSGAGCDEFLTVTDPDVIEATTVDPVADADAFSRSAYQNLAVAYGAMIVYSAWFTNEARVGDTFPTRNEYGRRIVSTVNGTHSGDVWSPLARTINTAEDVLELLAGVPDAARNVSIARAALTSGYAVLLTAETFCDGSIPTGEKDGVIRYGKPMDRDQMLDIAIARLEQAKSVGAAAGDPSIARAARVGIARAYLFKGDKASAYAEASTVPADFSHELTYVDDRSARGRLGNNVWAFSFTRESLVVGPEWRAMADTEKDPRISYVDGKRLAQDGQLQFYIQQKFPAWNAPIRLASGLEARYIKAEAGTMQEQLDLIGERRAANGLPAFSSSDPSAVLTELMDQKGRDFWLEGKRMGDWRRNPNNVKYILQPGNNYYKPQVGTVSDQVCWPLPLNETDNNPNFD